MERARTIRKMFATGVVALAATLAMALAAPLTSPAGAAPVVQPTIDPFSRASVLAAYRNTLQEAQVVPVGWTGSTSSCTRGTESAASIDATRAAVNFYRAMNGLGPVTMRSDLNDKAMAAALMMHAAGRLEHFPGPTWPCYTAAGDEAAGSSNLAGGTMAAPAVDAYMADRGDANAVAGHRRWILNPRGSVYGTGSTSSYNALWVFGPPAARPAGVNWVAWPSAGFVPKALFTPRFSLSSNQDPGANYASAKVSVRTGATSLPVVVHPPVDGFGDKTLVWDVTLPSGFEASTSDVRFDITVSGIRSSSGAVVPTRSYSSTAVVAAVPGAPTAVTATAGSGQATLSWAASASKSGSPITGYRVTPYLGTTPQPVRTFTTAATTQAITGLTSGKAYSFRVQAVNADGVGAVSGASNPVTPTRAPWSPYSSWTHLVDQMFVQLVGRTPTNPEREQWVGSLSSGSSTPGGMVASLRTSNDHRLNVDPVTRLYSGYYLRTPDRSGLDYWIAQRRGGRSLKAISESFSQSAEFRQRYGAMSNRQFVERVYLNVLGRLGDQSGMDFWTTELDSGRRTRGSVMLGFSESTEYRNAQSSEATVSVLHILLLDRAPTTSEMSSGVSSLDGGTSVALYAQSILRQVVT